MADTVRELLKRGGDANERSRVSSRISWTALHNAAERGHAAVAEVLLRHGANGNAKDEARRTPLHRAALGSHEGVVRVLLEHGADVNLADDVGATALHIAALIQSVDVVSILLANGANPNVRNAKGATPLHEAISLFLPDEHEAGPSVIETLISGGADVNAVDNKKRTPLDVARTKDAAWVAELLRKCGGVSGDSQEG